MAHKGLKISKVLPESIAEELEICPGDRIISMNGKPVKDVIDYSFMVGEENLIIELAKPNNEVWEVDIEKDLDEDLGIEPEEMKIKQCPNKCLFCFVDQMPEGERNALYIRDEDYRFSFLFGNYITLTNLSKRDKQRIFDQKMSPLYISVHTTDQELRKQLLENPRAKPILGEIAEMASHNILMHTQIVLCPGLNDGNYLTNSVEELAARYPAVESLSIVPVGLTGHREGLPEVTPVSPDYARQALKDIAHWQQHFKKKLGVPFVLAADEWFVIADQDFPPLATYGDLQQVENGVGMLPLFLNTFKYRDFSAPLLLDAPTRFFMVTGTSFSSYLEDCLAKVTTVGLTLEVVTVINNFFGDSVTVAGLITAQDIIAAVKSAAERAAPNERLMCLIPAVMLDDAGHYFLDGKTADDVENTLGIAVRIVPPEAEAFLDILASGAIFDPREPIVLEESLGMVNGPC